MTSLKSKELQTPEAMVLLYIINIALKNQLALRKQTLPLHVLVLVYPLFSILSLPLIVSNLYSDKTDIHSYNSVFCH